MTHEKWSDAKLVWISEDRGRSAITFISIASISNPEKRARNLGNAEKALAEIQRGLMSPAFHGLNEHQVAFLEERRAEIARALAQF